MALYLRRAMRLRNTIQTALYLRGSNTQTHDISHLLISHNQQILHSQNSTPFPSFALLGDSRRGFAKGKRSKDDSGGSTMELAPDIGPSVKASASSQMDAAILALSRELAKLRTGRASAGMLDHIIVETEGVKMQLNHLAVVSVIDSKTLSVNPYDPNTLKALEKAIVSSPLGLNPKVDGERLVAVIPPLTKEHMQAMCKVVAKSSEDVKQSIRKARQKALDSIKKASSSFPKDEAKRLEKEIDELTKKFVKSADELCKAKEKEIAQG
ncbi:adenosine-5'-phosphosulfate (APS) kinase 3 [Hibiscus syriacus]|uniref:Ribosome-recycling factor, chloroplastic n=1 Tax=Hibiscus syriacus TaxID=106335 RepID=A0A6A3CP25_HIBSY|nr:ribosome-recycling factor-like [Hibiscus syriacus]KAE8731225.1 adenosine-5'-phosphosulfate (APS) kinase 3 [Hibiscus syriacus]